MPTARCSLQTVDDLPASQPTTAHTDFGNGSSSLALPIRLSVVKLPPGSQDPRVSSALAYTAAAPQPHPDEPRPGGESSAAPVLQGRAWLWSHWVPASGIHGPASSSCSLPSWAGWPGSAAAMPEWAMAGGAGWGWSEGPAIGVPAGCAPRVGVSGPWAALGGWNGLLSWAEVWCLGLHFPIHTV